MIRIEFLEYEDRKTNIAEKILRQIPKWFGNEEALVDYTLGAKEKPFLVVYDDEEEIGFLSIKFNNKSTAEIYVMGMLEEYHRNRIGSRLVLQCERYLRKLGYRFLMVKTLGESCEYEPYERTREFYTKIGFYPLEELMEVWEDPCLLMVKNI